MADLSVYQETSVTTENKGKLVVLLYEGGIKFLKLAIREIEAGNPEAKGKYINKTVDIINELNNVLDIEAGGEIAQNLRSLYTYMLKRLAEANMTQDINILKEIIGLMEELNEGWKQIV